MKPWGSQVSLLHALLSVSLCGTEKMASRGPGAAMSALVATRRWRNLPHGCRLVCRFRPCCTAGGVPPWDALDYASCGVAAGRPPSPKDRQPGSDDAGPDISIRRVAHSLRTAFQDSRLSLRIAKAAS